MTKTTRMILLMVSMDLLQISATIAGRAPASIATATIVVLSIIVITQQFTIRRLEKDGA